MSVVGGDGAVIGSKADERVPREEGRAHTRGQGGALRGTAITSTSAEIGGKTTAPYSRSLPPARSFRTIHAVFKLPTSYPLTGQARNRTSRPQIPPIWRGPFECLPMLVMSCCQWRASDLLGHISIPRKICYVIYALNVTSCATNRDFDGRPVIVDLESVCRSCGPISL